MSFCLQKKGCSTSLRGGSALCVPLQPGHTTLHCRFTSDSGAKGTSVVGSDDGDSGVGGDRSPVSRRVTSAPSSPLRDAIPSKALWQQDTDSMM